MKTLTSSKKNIRIINSLKRNVKFRYKMEIDWENYDQIGMPFDLFDQIEKVAPDDMHYIIPFYLILYREALRQKTDSPQVSFKYFKKELNYTRKKATFAFKILSRLHFIELFPLIEV